MIAALAAMTLTAFAQPSNQTFLAVVRPDGLLVPIAVYDGSAWWNRWPSGGEDDEDIHALPIPTTLAAVPKEWLPPGAPLPAEWRFFRGTGPEVRLRATEPVRPPDRELTTTIAIRSSYRAPKGEPLLSGAAGLAIAGPGQLSGFRTLSPRQSNRILRPLTSRLREVEKQEITRWLDAPEGKGASINLARPPSAVGRVATTAADSVVLRIPSRPFNGLHYAYLTGSKQYRLDHTTPGCAMNLALDGIVVIRSKGDIVSHQVSAHAYAGYCGDPAGSMMPLATLVLNGRLLWVVEYVGEGVSEYVLFDPNTSEAISLKGRWAFRDGRLHPARFQ